jgi:general secretion pathway protein H
MTLIEVLIVVVLVTLLSGTLIFGSGMLASTHQRAAAALIMGGVRLGLTRANATGRPVRMVFDLDERRIALEEATGSVMLRVQDDEHATGAGAEATTEAEREAQREAERILKGPRAPRAQFSPVKQFGFEDDDKPGRELGPGVRFRGVQTEHDSEPRIQGRAYLYFWPGGGTEAAAIQLQRGESEGLTVTVSALTGRAKIERGFIELPPDRLERDYSEREEP